MSLQVKVPIADITSILADVLLVKAKTDNLPSDPADESILEGELARKYSFMDFWSLNEDKLTITNTAGNIAFPNIVVAGLPSGATQKRVVLIMTCRAIEDDSASPNKINAASKTLRIKKSTGGWAADSLVGITFAQDSLYCAADAKEAGPTIIGSHDVKGEVDGDGTYNVMSNQDDTSDAIVVVAASLYLYDVQVGVRIFFE